jgi:hypothetical protein
MDTFFSEKIEQIKSSFFGCFFGDTKSNKSKLTELKKPFQCNTGMAFYFRASGIMKG